MVLQIHNARLSNMTFIECRNLTDLVAILLAAVDGQNCFPAWSTINNVALSPFPADMNVYRDRSEELLAQGKMALISLVKEQYTVKDHETVVVSYDDDPYWYIQSLFWAFITGRDWKEHQEASQLQHARKLYIGSPYIPSESIMGYSKYTAHYLTGTDPAILNYLLIKTLLYVPEEVGDGVILRVEEQDPTFTKKYPELCEPATVLNVRMKKGAHTLFIYGHSGDDFLITDSMVLCGKQAKASYKVLANKDIAPVCYNTGKCFTDVLPSWINKKSYVRATEDLPFHHIVLFGCRSFYLGHNPYGPYFDLALGAVSGQAVSYIGSYENIDAELEQVFFLSALLRTGYTIGEALDIYNTWVASSFHGRSPLRAIGDPQIQHVTKNPINEFYLNQPGIIELNEPVWTLEIVIDYVLSPTCTVDVIPINSDDERDLVYFAMQRQEQSTTIWVFAPRKLKPGQYRINFDNFLDLRQLDNKLVNLHDRLNILEHLQIIESETRKNIKLLRNNIDHVTQNIVSSLERVNSEKLKQLMVEVLEQIPNVQKSVLVPLINNLDKETANPLMLYDERRMYGSDYVYDCPICNQKMSISELLFPGIPRSGRLREQCVNCEMMLERPQSSQTEMKVRVEEFLDKAVATITLINHSDDFVHASIGGVIEMGAQWGSQLIPDYMEETLEPKQTITKDIIIQSKHLPLVPRQYLFILALIDMEWFYYSVGLLPRKKYVPEA